MTRRALICFTANHTDGSLSDGWGTCNLPWPPSHEDLQSKLDDFAKRKVRCVGATITSLTWISDPVDSE